MIIKEQLQRIINLRVFTVIVLCNTLMILLRIYNSTNCQYEVFYGFGSNWKCDKNFTAISKAGNEKLATFKAVEKKKTILYWTKMFNSKNFYFGEGDIFEGCSTSSCMGTDDRKYQSVEKFDAIMFHGPELNDTDLPQTRLPHQYYIFVDLETQKFHPIPNKPDFRNFFNLTIAYRRDADIMRPYGVFRNITSNEVIPPYIPAVWVNVSNGVVDENTRILYKTKSKMAAWFVSHCTTNSKRENIAKKLQDYITVDIYGKCGSLQCPRTEEVECYKNLETNYFFYFSFENSMCQDYLTEKVYKPFDYYVIPVVYGAADYTSFLPPNSFIDVLDFPSIEALAYYLTELSQNEERYSEYFKLRSFYKVDYTKKYIICEFCQVLHQLNSSNQVIEDIYKWWVQGSKCIPPPEII